MKMGFLFRRFYTYFESIIREGFNLGVHLFWHLFSIDKFKKNPKKGNKILIVTGGEMGDTYNVLGVLNKITKKYPKKEIYFLTKEKNMNFVKNPDINTINLKKARNLIKDNFFDYALFKSRPDAVFDDEMYKIIKKIPYRMGSGGVSPRKFLTDILPNRKFLGLNKLVYRKDGMKEFFCLLNKIGISLDRTLSFYFTKEGDKKAKKFMKKHKKAFSKKVIFFHPGSGTSLKAKKENKVPSHDWPKENWAELADKLIKEYNAQIIFTGSKKEKKLIKSIIKKIKNKSRVIDSSGELSIESIAFLMNKKGKFLVSIDTGMAHIGALSGIFVFDLFGPFPPELALPQTKKKKVLFNNKIICTKCRKYFCPEKDPICMKGLNVKRVLGEIKKSINLKIKKDK